MSNIILANGPKTQVVDWPAFLARPEMITPINEVSGDKSSHSVSWIAKFPHLHELVVVKVTGLLEEDTFSRHTDALRLATLSEDYHRALKTHGGIRIPNLEGTVIGNHHGRICFAQIMTYMGQCLLDAIVSYPLDHQLAAVRKVMRQVCSLLPSQNGGRPLGVGIDPKLTNFTMSASGDVAFVDFVWPLTSSTLDLLHPDTRSIWLNRYFTADGIIQGLLISITRCLPDVFPLIEREEGYLISRVVSRNRELYQSPNLISEVKPDDGDRLRLLACTAFRSPEDTWKRERALSLTRPNPTGGIDAAAIALCKTELLQWLTGSP